jgi:hypothetical protein
MRRVKVHFEGISTYSQSKMHEEPKLPKETADAYETRTWRSKCTVDKDGNILIPAMAIKFSLAAAAKKLGTQIPGRGKSTYTKYFEADVVPMNDAKLEVKQADVKSERLNVNADGVRGSGKRVWRTFPVIDAGYKSYLEFTIMDDTITKEVFEDVFYAAGNGIGIGRFRPEKGGTNGRFRATKFEWQ